MSTWCTFIKDDMKTRIGTGEPLPCRLTLQSLAKHYEVSLTPVRQAIVELIDESYIKKQDNGRLAVNEKKIGTWSDSTDRARPAPPKDYFEEIREGVVLTCLKGEPVFLREEDTAARYGISGTAIRQIFSRLAGSGIIEHVPRRGWRVRPFRKQQLKEFTQVRKVLELEAMWLAWPKLVDTDLQEMRDGNVLPQSDNERPKVNDGIHRYLIEKADNQYIADFMDRHMRFFGVLFSWEGSDHQAAIDTVHQHWAVLDALLARDRRAARKALLAHLDYDHTLLKNAGLKSDAAKAGS
ncbi:MAG: GntR family transcriptional regulator [Pirellulales bacterium]|nr:GntR family transcriptional regulator [Pirellulales bacterium]